MEQQGGNHTILCRMGCGFYGNPMYDGMCSKCHKDNVKRRQQTSSPTQLSSGRVSPHSSVCTQTPEMSTSNAGSEAAVQALDTNTTPSVETATPTVAAPNQDKIKIDDENDDSNDGAIASCSLDDESESDADKKSPKKNRCHTCKKKLGLTGFPCRCGGLFCGSHRYSDKHECSFNYKELAQGEIRKNNPVIVAAKIQKI